jgi:hypothetical protein
MLGQRIFGNYGGSRDKECIQNFSGGNLLEDVPWT